MVCLGLELNFSKDSVGFEKKEEDDEVVDDLYNIAHDANKMYEIVHDKEFYIADSYSLFERIMNLGIKELYYQDTVSCDYTRKEEELNEMIRDEAISKAYNTMSIEEKTEINRLRKIKYLKLQKEESEKTVLKKRSNKIFNNYLKVIDKELYMHL